MTQSGKVLHLTQSAVSQIIAGLEDSLGVKLFDRSVRPIALTTAGRILLERGRQIIRDTKEALRETQTLERRRLASLTIAMTDSMSAVLGPHLYTEMHELSGYWRLWSGLSPYHREEFLSHNIDIILATSNIMEELSGLVRHKVFQEPYILIFPKDYDGDTELHSGVRDIPFLRFSLRSAMGLRIERQLNRLRLRFPELVEFDRGPAHTMAVAQGMGWGVTTPLCLLEKPDMLDDIQIRPISRGAFSRHFDLIAREEFLGDLPTEMAARSRNILREKCLPPLYERVPWLEEKFRWEEYEELDQPETEEIE